MEKFLIELLGNTDVYTYCAWLLLAFIGAFTRMLVLSKMKYKDAEGTPRKFSFWFMIQDNLINLVIGFFITFIFLRFSFETLSLEPSAWIAVLVGSCNDYLANKFVKFSLSVRK